MMYRISTPLSFNFQKIFFAALMFVTAYLTTITVNAEAGHDNAPVIVTGMAGYSVIFHEN